MPGPDLSKYITFKDALNRAFEKYNELVQVESEIIQLPSKDNDNTAITAATVRAYNAELGEWLTFRDIGDASPNNVSRNIAPHLIRMASTRAEGRALRLAINDGRTTLEELNEDSQHQPQQQSHQPEPRPTPESSGAVRGGAQQASPQSSEKDTGGKTEKQRKYLAWLSGQKLAGGVKELESNYGYSLEEFPVGEAREAIDRLKEMPDGGQE